MAQATRREAFLTDLGSLLGILAVLVPVWGGLAVMLEVQAIGLPAQPALQHISATALAAEGMRRTWWIVPGVAAAWLAARPLLEHGRRVVDAVLPWFLATVAVALSLSALMIPATVFALVLSDETCLILALGVVLLVVPVGALGAAAWLVHASDSDDEAGDASGDEVGDASGDEAGDESRSAAQSRRQRLAVWIAPLRDAASATRQWYLIFVAGVALGVIGAELKGPGEPLVAVAVVVGLFATFGGTVSWIKVTHPGLGDDLLGAAEDDDCDREPDTQQAAAPAAAPDPEDAQGPVAGLSDERRALDDRKGVPVGPAAWIVLLVVICALLPLPMVLFVLLTVCAAVGLRSEKLYERKPVLALRLYGMSLVITSAIAWQAVPPALPVVSGGGKSEVDAVFFSDTEQRLLVHCAANRAPTWLITSGDGDLVIKPVERRVSVDSPSLATVLGVGGKAMRGWSAKIWHAYSPKMPEDAGPRCRLPLETKKSTAAAPDG